MSHDMSHDHMMLRSIRVRVEIYISRGKEKYTLVMVQYSGTELTLKACCNRRLDYTSYTAVHS